MIIATGQRRPYYRNPPYCPVDDSRSLTYFSHCALAVKADQSQAAKLAWFCGCIGFGNTCPYLYNLKKIVFIQYPKIEK